MATVFVNPTKPRRRKKRRNVQMAKRRSPRKRVTRRRRRRNAGVTSFVQPRANNPLILQNPRRRKRRNPAKLNLNTMMTKVLTYSGGSAVGAGINILAIRRIENVWMRNGARVAAAVLGGNFLKGEMGAAMAGATLYPLFAEVALQFNLVPGMEGEDTEADLEELAADLEAALDDIDLDEQYHDEELYVP